MGFTNAFINSVTAVNSHLGMSYFRGGFVASMTGLKETRFKEIVKIIKSPT